MNQLTRLEACRKIRIESLVTPVQGEQLIRGGFIHRFTVLMHNTTKNDQIHAVFRSDHSVRYYPVRVTWKQVLHFIRKYYPRKLA